MKVVYVAERYCTPISLNQIHVEAVPTPQLAQARMDVTPTSRLTSERMVPYCSVEELEKIFKESPELGTTGRLLLDLITRLWTDCPKRDEDIDTSDAPELDEGFFKKAVLTRPGESLIPKPEDK